MSSCHVESQYDLRTNDNLEGVTYNNVCRATVYTIEMLLRVRQIEHPAQQENTLLPYGLSEIKLLTLRNSQACA